MSAGFARLSYGKFLLYATPVALIEYIIFLITGYLLGSSYMLAVKYIQYGSIAIAFILVAMVAAYFYGSKYIKTELTKMEEKK